MRMGLKHIPKMIRVSVVLFLFSLSIFFVSNAVQNMLLYLIFIYVCMYIVNYDSIGYILRIYAKLRQLFIDSKCVRHKYYQILYAKMR